MLSSLRQPLYDRELYTGFRDYLLAKGFSFIGEGGFRNAYQRGKIVVKIPKSRCGFEDNIGEAYAYHKHRKEPCERGYYYAPCRLLSNGCLVMVYVEQTKWIQETIPKWARYIDGRQCGYYNGRVVAYDSGCDTSHLWAEAKQWAGLGG